jgi:hypothetical protein
MDNVETDKPVQYAMVLDSQGKAAIIEFSTAVSRIGLFSGVKIMDGDVIKEPPQEMFFPGYAPMAEPIEAYTRYWFDRVGTKARKWKIGFQAPNGFSVPSAEVVLLAYVRTEDWPDFEGINDHAVNSY